MKFKFSYLLLVILISSIYSIHAISLRDWAKEHDAPSMKYLGMGIWRLDLDKLELDTIDGIDELEVYAGQVKLMLKNIDYLILNLPHNNLTELSKDILNLNIVDLSLYNNKLSYVPSFVNEMRHLRTLDLRQNPIKTSTEVLKYITFEGS